MIDVTGKTPLTIKQCKEGMVVYHKDGMFGVCRHKYDSTTIIVIDSTGSEDFWPITKCYYVADSLPKHHEEILAYAYGAEIKAAFGGHPWKSTLKPTFSEDAHYKAAIPDHPPMSAEEASIRDEINEHKKALVELEARLKGLE